MEDDRGSGEPTTTDQAREHAKAYLAKMLPIQIGDIPQSLRDQPHWGVWELHPNPERPEKPRKVPVPAVGSRTALDAIGGFEGAVERLFEDKAAGLALHLGNGLAGIDLDHCRNPDTGELSPAAMTLLDAMSDTYAEVSVSGTGIHLLVRTDHKAKSNKAVLDTDDGPLEVEAYSEGRFFTVTGHVLTTTPGSEDVPRGTEISDSEACQTVFKQLCEEIRLAKRKARNAQLDKSEARLTQDSKPTGTVTVVRRTEIMLAALELIRERGQAVDGSGCRDVMLVACRICMDFELTLEESMLTLGLWNADNEPPWGPDNLKDIYGKAQSGREGDPDEALTKLAKAKLKLIRDSEADDERRHCRPRPKKGEPIASKAYNVSVVLRYARQWVGVLRYDEFKNQVVKAEPPQIGRAHV